MKTADKKEKLTVELTLTVEAADYAEAERKKLADFRRRADIKGFRKGNVPMSLVQRLYGDQALVEAVNEKIGEGLQNYIDENKLHVLGEPLSSANQKEIEWKSGSDFEFVFDIAVAPEVKVAVEKTDEIVKYNITPMAKEKEEMTKNLTKYYEEKKEGEPKSAEDITAEVEDRLKDNYAQEAEWRLSKDIRDFYVAKSGVELPEEFLKRWLVEANKGKVSAEDVEKEFDGFVQDFKWQLVRGSLMKDWGFDVSQDEVLEAAKAFITYQYAMYGIGNVPEDMIQEAVKNVLQDQKQVDRLVEQVEDQKVMGKIKETVAFKAKKISSDKFRAL